jgi:hypothetical protein
VQWASLTEAMRRPESIALQGWIDEGDQRRYTSTRQVAGGTEYVRTVSEFMSPKAKRTPIADSDYASLYLVPGTELPVQLPLFEYYAPKRQQLNSRQVPQARPDQGQLPFGGVCSSTRPGSSAVSRPSLRSIRPLTRSATTPCDSRRGCT